MSATARQYDPNTATVDDWIAFSATWLRHYYPHLVPYYLVVTFRGADGREDPDVKIQIPLLGYRL